MVLALEQDEKIVSLFWARSKSGTSFYPLSGETGVERPIGPPPAGLFRPPYDFMILEPMAVERF